MRFGQFVFCFDYRFLIYSIIPVTIAATTKTPAAIIQMGGPETKTAVGPSAPPMMPMEVEVFIAKSPL